MLSHASFSVSDLEKSSIFYDAILEPLGYVRVWTLADAVGYGRKGKEDEFAIKQRVNKVNVPSPGFHLAFTAENREAVNEFYRAALRSGGKENGAPGLRKRYGEDYYAAFVLDPDGYEIEAVANTK